MTEFADKVAIIVGGASGVGRATAEALGRLGCRLVIADLGCAPDGTGHDPDVVADTAQQLEDAGAEVLALALDAAEPASAHQLVEAALARFGRVDLGVYCAGFHHERALLRGDGEAELERVLAVHLFGAMRFTQELARALVAAKSAGSIVLATSAAGFFGSAGHGALAVASGGLVGFVKTAATELRRHKIRVNALVPTARTRLTEQLPLFASIRAESLTPGHVAQGICHLLSEAAADVLGEVIGVAGGRIYAFRHAETSGAFLEGDTLPSLASIAASWRDVTRR
jgi:NAD(P)-dependent dehydrogenase (short-subunit alcohol dehydrogenase family)